MPTSISPQMMREIIMDHYSNPSHKGTPSNKEDYLSIEMNSASCIDDVFLYLKVEDDLIKEAYFDGVACTISTASTDILCELIIDQTKERALYIVDQYQKMIYEKEFDEDAIGELIAFVNTYKQAARIKCATLGSIGIATLLENKKDEQEG